MGYAQLEVIENRLLMKRNLFDLYKKYLSNINEIELIESSDNSISNYWLVTISLKFDELSRLKKERHELLLEAHNMK